MDQFHPGSTQEIKTVKYAGFWARFFAFIIDSLILIVPNILIGYIIDGSFWETSGWTNVATLIFDWLYFSLQESGAKQATLGKRVLDIKVTDLDGGRISFARATGRYFSKIISAIILFIGFIMAGFDTRKQALHDKIANTLVISEEPVQ